MKKRIADILAVLAEHIELAGVSDTSQKAIESLLENELKESFKAGAQAERRKGKRE